ncbi:MAG: DsrE family protein, partial [Chloroflexota bacterium]
MKILFIINDAPYGSEKAYNAFRMAMTLQKEHEEVDVRIFLLADAVICALPSQV